MLVIVCLVMYLFAEFDDAANLLAANPDATTISIDEPVEIPKNQHGRLQEPGREEDDELLGTDDSDKTEVRLSDLQRTHTVVLTALLNCYMIHSKHHPV